MIFLSYSEIHIDGRAISNTAFGLLIRVTQPVNAVLEVQYFLQEPLVPT